MRRLGVHRSGTETQREPELTTFESKEVIEATEKHNHGPGAIKVPLVFSVSLCLCGANRDVL
jgi:hypothetical protein